MEQEIKLEVIPYPIKFMFGGFFVILGTMGLLLLMLTIAQNPSGLGTEAKNFIFGDLKTAASVLSLVVILCMAVFYIKNTSLKILQNQLVLTSPSAKGWSLDISQISKISYSLTPAKQNFTATVGQTVYSIPFRIIDPNGLSQSIKNINPNLQITTVA
jgi:hypothetical protein